jgi:hypothetical protein
MFTVPVTLKVRGNAMVQGRQQWKRWRLRTRMALGQRQWIARIVLRPSTAWRNAFRMHFPKSKIQDPRVAEKSCANLGFGICQNTLTNPYQNSLGIQDFDQESCGNLGSWILDLGKDAFWMHSLRMQNALKYKDGRIKINTRKNQNQHYAYYPLCLLTQPSDEYVKKVGFRGGP